MNWVIDVGVWNLFLVMKDCFFFLVGDKLCCCFVVDKYCVEIYLVGIFRWEVVEVKVKKGKINYDIV